MQRKLIVTGDGSHSIEVPPLSATYHSVHGAIQESRHVFIDAGFNAPERFKRSDALNVLEVGFGTGLNALLTLIEAERVNQKIYYETVEPYPLTMEEVKLLNYLPLIGRADLQENFERFHEAPWEERIEISPSFSFLKRRDDLLNFETTETFALIYFDAFDPKVQPELWSEEVFKKMFSILNSGGVLVTYSSKGTVRRAMQAAGFTVEKHPGPPGKREIVRAVKV